MKRVLRSLALVAIAVVSFNAAKAQNPHFKKGEDPVLTITTHPVTGHVSGTIYGCGNVKNVLITLASSWFLTYDCVKNNSTHVPGIFQGIDADLSASAEWTPSKNGKVEFSEENDIETYASYAKYGWAKSGKFCPAMNNDNSPWDIIITDYKLKSYTISIDGVQVWPK